MSDVIAQVAAAFDVPDKEWEKEWEAASRSSDSRSSYNRYGPEMTAEVGKRVTQGIREAVLALVAPLVSEGAVAAAEIHQRDAVVARLTDELVESHVQIAKLKAQVQAARCLVKDDAQ